MDRLTFIYIYIYIYLYTRRKRARAYARAFILVGGSAPQSTLYILRFLGQGLGILASSVQGKNVQKHIYIYIYIPINLTLCHEIIAKSMRNPPNMLQNRRQAIP